MQKECDIGSLFSRVTSDVSKALFVLEENGIQAANDNGDICITAEMMNRIYSMLRYGYGTFRRSVIIDALDTIIKSRCSINDYQSNENNTLDKFLAEFHITDSKLEVN